MPRKDPPPHDAAASRSGSDKLARVTQKPGTEWSKLVTTIRPVQADIAWADDADQPTIPPAADGAATSAFERVTVAPPVPESEYVARMMSGIESSATTALPAPEALPLAFAESAPPAALTAPTAPAPANPALAFGATLGETLDLVGARAASVKPGPIPVATLRDIRDRVDVGDFSGALSAAEGVLEQDPANADAVVYAEHCRGKLKQMYIARLGGLQRTPRVNTTPEQLRWLALDHRAGFLLSLVDGRSTLDEVLDMSGMPELDALRLLIQLLQQNVLKVD